MTWYRFALLADRLGFDSEVIRQLKADDPYRIEARNFLLKHNPPELYTFDPQLFEECVEQIARTRAAAVEKGQWYIKPPMVVDGPGEPLPRRRGRFFQTAYEYERNYLFLDILYDAADARGKGITSLFVRRSAYFAFFGRRVPSATAEAAQGRPPRNPGGKSGPAPPQAPAAEPSAPKRARRDRPTPPPPSSQEQVALVPVSQASENSSSQEQMQLVPASQASENVSIHPHFLDYASQETEQ